MRKMIFTTIQNSVSKFLPLCQNTAQLLPTFNDVNDHAYISDNWGRQDGQTLRGSCLAISAQLSREEQGQHHHDEAARHWCSNIFSPSSTNPGLSTPFFHTRNLPPLSPYTNLAHPPSAHSPASLLSSNLAISLTFCLSKLFACLVLNRLCYYLESKILIYPT